MKRNLGKLTLHRETIRSFREDALRGVAGGKGPTAIDCSVTCLRAQDTDDCNLPLAHTPYNR